MLLKKVTSPLMVTILLVSTSVAMAADKPDDILGNWRMVDQVSGFQRGVAEVKKDNKTGKYYVVLKKVTPRKGYQPKEICDNCPGKFKGQKIEGIMFMWNITPVKGKPHEYSDGYGYHPLNGKMHRGDFKISPSGNTLLIRASALETKFLHRNITWVR